MSVSGVVCTCGLANGHGDKECAHVDIWGLVLGWVGVENRMEFEGVVIVVAITS